MPPRLGSSARPLAAVARAALAPPRSPRRPSPGPSPALAALAVLSALAALALLSIPASPAAAAPSRTKRAAASVAAATGPSKEELEARRAELAARLKGQGFTVVVEAPFVVVGDEAPAKVRARASGFLRSTVAHLEQEWFAKRPAKVLEVWLFKDEKTYRRGAKRYFDDEPETPYGYYSPADGALIMNIGPGAGTLSHELVHPYMEANFPAGPAWFNEGLASLFEAPRERDGKLWGVTNWRLTGLQRGLAAGAIPSLAVMMSTDAEGFYGADYDAYAMARFLCQYLQERGELGAMFQAFLADAEDPTGAAALRKVTGRSAAELDPIWQAWVRGLRR